MKQICLELGCGNRKKFDYSIGIDIVNYDCVDIVGNVVDVIKTIPSDSVDYIYASHFYHMSTS